MTALVEFEVVGVPKPQGSIKAFKVGNAIRTQPAGGASFAQWRNAVAQAAKDLMLGEVEQWARTIGGDDCRVPFDGPLGLSVEFRFPMPASRSKADRTAGACWKTTAPDTDKLIRTIGDALTAAGLIADDARIVALEARKIETTGWTGAVITLTRENPMP
jgi:Holliday junction resolvase RusA-like endonuclease